MSVFDYAGYDAAGQRRRGVIEASDVRDARKQLADKGILADRVRDAGSAKTTAAGAGTGAAGARITERIRFYEELSALLGAGVPMVESLGILLDTPGAGVAPRAIARIRDAVRDGQPLSRVLPDVFGVLQPFEAAVIDAGQRAGALAPMMGRLAGFLETQQALAEKVRAVLIYPLFVVVVAAVMVLGILGFGLPAIGRLLGEAGAPLPLMIRWAMRWGRITALGIVAGVAGLVVATRLLAVRAAGDRTWRQRLERALFRLPFLGAGYTVLINLRLVRTLELLVAGGHPLVDSLALAGTASGSVWVADTMAQAAERLRHGGCTPAQAVALSPPLAAAALPAWIRTGEAAGAMDRMLGRLGDRLEQRWERFTTRALNLLLPAIIVVVGVWVLAATLSILLPILDLNRMILQ